MEEPGEPIAIVGMGCVFPKAGDLQTYWQNILNGVDAITDVPEGRWESEFYDPTVTAVDRFYCRRGGFVDEFASFDALRFGIMPIAASGAEPDQLLALQVASDALLDAGISPDARVREKTAVVIGRGNYVGPGMTRLMQHVRTAQQLVVALRTLIPELTSAQLDQVKEDFQSRLGTYGPDTAIGLVPNLTASRISNRLDLQGPAYTVDAACASALIAVDNACRELRTGRADLALAGGVHLSHDVAFWSVFCQLGALSRSESIRPFDSKADGLLIGEGIGLVALERLSDALAAQRRIYAVIRGVGVASDGRDVSIMQPRPEGQLLALRRAWSDAGLEPNKIGLIEAHGTGTKAGDEAEIDTLRRFFGPTEGERATLGSVKSMIGHTMPAAGAAGLIKAALAVYHGQLPPSLHCDAPNQSLHDTRFQVRSRTEEWNDSKRIAGVNAFGFGGINAHVVLENNDSPAPRGRKRRKNRTGSAEVLGYFSADSTAELKRQLHSGGKGTTSGGSVRLVIVDPTPARRARAATYVDQETPLRGRDGMWFSPNTGLLSEPTSLAFMYPGVEAVFQPKIAGLAQAMDTAVPEQLLNDDLEHQGYSVIWLARLLTSAMERAGVHGHHLMGHSIGEWSAMIASGCIASAELDAFLDSLQEGTLEVPGVVFVAAGASQQRVLDAIGGEGELVISHDNCPHQVILCGPEEAADRYLPLLRKAGILSRKLPFRSGFHAPVFEPYIANHRDNFRKLKLTLPNRPLWSATICEEYPGSVEGIEQLSLRHLIEPVRFRELTEQVYEAGARVFVQVGVGSLVGFVDDTLGGRDHLAISMNSPRRSGIEQLRRVLGALWVEGLDVDLTHWDPAAKTTSRAKSLPLALGVPLIELKSPLSVSLQASPDSVAPVADVVANSFEALMSDVQRAVTDVRAAVTQRVAPEARRSIPREFKKSLYLSVESHPSLLDHSLIPQPVGWTNVADRNPVVPMTMLLELMREAAVEVCGGVAIGLRNVRARSWLAVHPPVEVSVTTTHLGEGRFRVVLDGYAEGEVLVASRYPEAPSPSFEPLKSPAAPLVTADRLYDDRWMFHGPGYQSVAAIDGVGQDGIDGHLTALEPSGALLDGAGQLFGYWVMESVDTDRLAMPVAIAAIDWFADEPPPEQPVKCRVRPSRLRSRDVEADLELSVDGRLLCAIQGWMDWRFEVDAQLWPVMKQTEEHLLSVVQPGGWVRFEDGGRSKTATDYLLRRYCSENERNEFNTLESNRRVRWLRGRIAIKDAVRWLLRERYDERVFPVEVEVSRAETGAPQVELFGRSLAVHVSLTHKENTSLAMASESGPIGLDLETIEPRDASFIRLAFDTQELKLLESLGKVDYAEWYMRLWCAKEAVSKALGTGLEGRPKGWVTTRIDGQRLYCQGHWVDTYETSDGIVGLVRFDGNGDT